VPGGRARSLCIRRDIGLPQKELRIPARDLVEGLDGGCVLPHEAEGDTALRQGVKVIRCEFQTTIQTIERFRQLTQLDQDAAEHHVGISGVKVPLNGGAGGRERLSNPSCGEKAIRETDQGDGSLRVLASCSRI
jgi:hypothetical protein